MCHESPTWYERSQHWPHKLTAAFAAASTRPRHHKPHLFADQRQSGWLTEIPA